MANHKNNGSNRSAEPDDGPEASRVGYRNPPPETRFPPGQSGNRRGRPRGAKGHKQIVRKIANEMHSVVEDGNRRKRSTFELVLLQLRNLAVQGNVQAFRSYCEVFSPRNRETPRLYGRAGTIRHPRRVGTGGGGEGQGLSAPPGRRSGARGHHVSGHRWQIGLHPTASDVFAERGESAARGPQHRRGDAAYLMRCVCLLFRRRFDWTSSATQASMRAWAADRLRTGSRAPPRAAAGLWVVGARRSARRSNRVPPHARDQCRGSQ